MSRRFENKLAVVTGAAAGIGKAVAERLAREGAQVMALDVNAAKLESAAAESGEPAISPAVCDVSDPEQVRAVVGAIRARYGRIDVLVNNAGIGNRTRVKLHEQPLEDFDRVMAVNVRGAYLMLQTVIPAMLEAGGGAVVNMASIGSFRATPLSSPYIVSKGAMLMMTRAAALEYAKENIRVNAVCPGTTATDILANSTPEVVEMLVSRSPQGRLGLPEEVAALTAFLASDEAPHITGGAYIIDGGRSAG